MLDVTWSGNFSHVSLLTCNCFRKFRFLSPQMCQLNNVVTWEMFVITLKQFPIHNKHHWIRHRRGTFICQEFFGLQTFLKQIDLTDLPTVATKVSSSKFPANIKRVWANKATLFLLTYGFLMISGGAKVN